MRSTRAFLQLALAAALGSAANRADADAFRTLPGPTATTYADSVIRYDPESNRGCIPTNPNFMDARAALGAPDYSGGSSGTGSVSLGSGGVLELLFTGSQLGNSGDARFDIVFYEVGGYSEACFIELRPVVPTTPEDLIALGLQDSDQDGFFEFGSIPGGTSEVDLDAFFNRTVGALGVRFDAVQIIDDVADRPSCTTTPGADIDAVAALQPYVGIAAGTWSSVKRLYRD